MIAASSSFVLTLGYWFCQNNKLPSTSAVTTYCCRLQVFSEYFKELEEESIRDNFVIIYELMDELMDFGYPQTTDSKILQEWVHGPFFSGIYEIK